MVALPRLRSGMARSALIPVVLVMPLLLPSGGLAQGTVQGEIEDRPAPVGRRYCLGGTSAGTLCNEDTDCPGSTCTDTNVFNLSVAVHYDAPAADLTAVENLLSGASAAIFDATDGQAEIGQATIHNNAFGTLEADLRVYPRTCTSGTNVGGACTGDANCPPNTGVNQGRCGVWWWSNTGSYKNAGSMHVSTNHIDDAGAGGGAILAHELVHLVFDARDEYQTRAGCGAAAGATGTAACPATAAGQPACLMDDGNDELCWGQGNPANLTDFSGGTHDATNVTEQSQCRSNRSCWDQVVWSWPSVFLKPAGAPDPAANGDVVAATNFINTSDTVRVVLVLDESGSMDFESPKRIERLKVAAKDFIALAENNTEVGIVSYATDAETSSGRANVAVGALGGNRTAWTNAIDGLTPDSRTNIGAGLKKAKDNIVTAGGVTANTFIVLMTDGRNNEPKPQATADADLTAKVADLLASGIPVYVTCTGGDPGLDSQCSDIGDGTNGFYVDSADAARLPEAFVEYHERITGHEAIDSLEGDLAKLRPGEIKTFYVDEGSEAATFTLQWHEPSARAEMTVTDPGGTVYQTNPMPQGRFVKVKNPRPGEWKVGIDPSGQSSRFVIRAFTRHRSNNLPAAVRYPSVLPGEEIFVYAYPKHLGRPVTHPTEKIVATVTLPDGSSDTLELLDQGRDTAGRGDDIAGDGIFTGVYRNTVQEGAYNFLIRADIDKWLLSQDAHEYENDRNESSRFVREVRLTAAVGDPRQPVLDPEDGPPGVVGEVEPWVRCCRAILTLQTLSLILLLLIVYLIWRCCCRGRTVG